MEGLLGIPFTEGNEVRVLKNGARIFPAMLDAIEQARSEIELLTFVYWRGEIAERMAEALSRRAEEGVNVRVLLDAVGAMPMSHRLIRRMSAAGVEIRWFRPVRTWKLWKVDNRTHRKVLIVDGTLGFTGGVGIAEEWEGDARNPDEWRDSHFRVRGPAVNGLRAAFFGNWAESSRAAWGKDFNIQDQPRCGDAAVQVIRSCASIGWSDVAAVLDGLIALSDRHIRISTAYFAPDRHWVAHFADAIRRGVEIDVVIPGPHIDRRVSELAGAKEMGDLLEAGVRIWRYQPTMLHSKILLVDGVAACIGSANFNQRSISKDDEVSLIVLDEALVSELEANFAEDLQRAERVRLEEFRSRGAFRRLRETVARPVRDSV